MKRRLATRVVEPSARILTFKRSAKNCRDQRPVYSCPLPVRSGPPRTKDVVRFLDRPPRTTRATANGAQCPAYERPSPTELLRPCRCWHAGRKPRPSPTPALVTTSPPAIEAAGICRRYGRRWALVEVGFAVPPGAAMVIAGRNGSGKTTLLRVLSTAIRADRGSARIAGFDIRDDRQQVRRHSSLLGHHSCLYEALTALENLRVTAHFLGRDASRELLLEKLAEVGLADRADDPVMTFSAGMRKRLTLARTLLQEASVVLLDEPYGHLDPAGFRFVDKVIGGLRARGATVLLATHLLERGAALCDQALVLEAGHVTWKGRAADLARDGGLETAGLPEGPGR